MNVHCQKGKARASERQVNESLQETVNRWQLNITA